MTMAEMRYGLTRRPTYDEVLNSYLSGGPNIKKPDRTATFIRASPQYQNLLKNDFVDLQRQQNNILTTQKRDIIVKEQVAKTDSDMQSVMARQQSFESAVSQHTFDELMSLTDQTLREDDLLNIFMASAEEEKENKEAKLQRMAAKGKADMDTYIGNTQSLNDKFLAAQATGTEILTGGGKYDAVAEGQRLDQLRVLPKGIKNPPPYISELPKEEEEREKIRRRIGLTAFDPQTRFARGSASSSSSSGIQVTDPPMTTTGERIPSKRKPLNKTNLEKIVEISKRK